MIPRPANRPLWQRLPMALGAAFLWAWKTLRLPRSFWPQPLRAMLDNWTPAMFRVVVGSCVTRAYIDQPCHLEAPAGFEPQASEVDGRFRLSRDELERFWTDGFLGPYDAYDGAAVNSLRETLLTARGLPSATFGLVTDRDLHLELPVMLQAMRNPAILERAAQLLGPDLLCWRSQIFLKQPGGSEVHWHQASTYMVEDYLEPALVPPDRNRLFQLTIWVALDAATAENGCLRFRPGSHDRIRTLRLGGASSFYQVSYELEIEPETRPPVEVEVAPGQFVIFSERVIHGSGPNRTSGPRLAFNYRLVPPDVAVYPGKTLHGAMHMGQIYNLEKWGVVTLRGHNRPDLSRRVSGQA